ncbi:TolB family protein [Candidatus Palauibacter sp.]|uniref:TolB family protein n=1 Tax=Candidatus Palauibacter sp. TaxID=3101350 RepID=UPI003AF21095
MNPTYVALGPTRALVALLAAFGVAACTAEAGQDTGGVARDPLPGERRFASLTQLTFEGENAEAYFSSDGERLIFQRRYEGEYECDQIFTISVEGGDRNLVSTGLGRTTCAYFFPDDSRIVYSSTHHASEACPTPPDLRQGYVWALYDYDIYTARPDGSDVQAIFSSPGYDAEATISPDGSRIVFTSTRDGDLDIYSMNPDGSDVRQLTDEPGYDGGPFFSPDGSKIVYRARHPESEEELADYQALLADNLVRPGVLDIYVMDADGSNRVRLTDNGAANFAPFFHPSGEKVIFASNLHDPDSRNFDLFMIDLDGTGLEQVTFSEEFESFPMFTPGGRRLVFGSNRHGSHEGNTNLFIAEWIDELPE